MTLWWALVGLALAAQPVSSTLLRLPDTGQTGNYTPTFGEDADYTIHPPYWSPNGDGTVTDTVTGLVWQQVDGGEMTFEAAQQYAVALVLGGFDDWRLPTAAEAFTILNHGLSNPALSQAAFPASAAEYWWTSDVQADNANKVWVTNAGGGIGNHLKTETLSAGGSKRFHVRAVRQPLPATPLASRFTDHGDGTVTDHLTRLVWQQTPLNDTLTWEQALNYAEGLSLGGHDDWRLPNIKELRSLNDETRVNPSVNTAIFPAIGVRKYWSSTTLPNPNLTTRAWYLDTRFGITTYDLKTRRQYLICVRGPVEDGVSGTQSPVKPTAAWRVFPNPWVSTLHVTPPVAPEVVFELRNAVGQVIFNGPRLEQQDFSNLPKGVYWLRQLNDNQVVKVVKI